MFSNFSLKIKKISAREILDSRGNPTVEATVVLKNNLSTKASVPSGASIGVHEAWELRDGDKKRYGGLGVQKAVNNVNKKIAPALLNHSVVDQTKIDELLIKLDGTKNKSHIGANAILAVSMACARVAAKSKGMPLYRYLRAQTKLSLASYKLPVPMFNIFNGGKHADTNLDFQEFMIIPQKVTGGFVEQLRAGAEVFHALAKVLLKYDRDTDVGNEGGYAPDINSTVDAIKYILEAIKLAGYNSKKNEIFLGVDVGSSELYNHKTKRYVFQLDEHELSREQMIELFTTWLKKYPFMSFEDPLDQDDWQGWQQITKNLGRHSMIIGDDLFVTNSARLQKGIDSGAANAILIKLNQIGTVTETLRTVELAKNNNYRTIISHRSGETVDDFIADLAVAVNADFIKAGATSRGERVAKYNRLLEIAEDI